METGGKSQTDAVAIFVGSATLAAVTTTPSKEGMEDGAVYRPVGSMLPTGGFKAQVTD